MLTWPEVRLISAPGMKKGDTRRGPRSLISRAVSAIELSPPMPEPIITPVRSRLSSSSGIQPDWDVTADGQTFVFFEESNQQGRGTLVTMVTNFNKELARLVARVAN
jgi:hypothetical protein